MGRPEAATASRKRNAAERVKRGICRFCIKKITEGRTMCQEHLEKTRITNKKHREKMKKIYDEEEAEDYENI